MSWMMDLITHFINLVLRLLVMQVMMMMTCTGYPVLSTLSHWKALQGCRSSHTMGPPFHLFIPQFLCNKQEEFLKLTLGKEKLCKKEQWSGKDLVSFTCAEGLKKTGFCTFVLIGYIFIFVFTVLVICMRAYLHGAYVLRNN